MDTRQRIIAASVVVVALVSAIAIGSAMAGSVKTTTMGPPDLPTKTTSPPTTEAPTTTITTSDSEGGPSIEVTTDKSEEIDEGETVALTATVTREDGSPVEGATVTFVSLGFGGEFKTGPSVTTNAEGTATADWLFTVPASDLSKDDMPPAASVTMIGQATVDGQQAETLIRLPVRVNCEECHEEGQYE